MHTFKVELEDGKDRIVHADRVDWDAFIVTFYAVPSWEDRTKDRRVAFFNRDKVVAFTKIEAAAA